MVSNTASMMRSASPTFSSPTTPLISAMRLAGASAGMPPRAAVASQFFCITPMTALELLLGGLDQGHRHAGIGKRHRDTAAHGAGADNGDARDRARLGTFRNARDLGRLALGEEGVALRLGLVAGDQLEEAFALLAQALVERQVDRIADRVGGRERRLQPARLLGDGGDRIGEDRAIGLGGRAASESSSRSRCNGRPSATTLRANSTPPAAGPSMISATRPLRCASAALIGSPPTIILTASSGPTARGSRWVPPAPGSRPSLTSGRPSFASLVATR